MADDLKVIGIESPKRLGIDPNDPLIELVDNLIHNNSRNIDDCIIWTGDTDAHDNPYSYYLTEHKLQYKVYPKRLAYDTKLLTPKVESHERIMSSCGNKRCVNRDHLIVVNKNTLKPINKPKRGQ